MSKILGKPLIIIIGSLTGIFLLLVGGYQAYRKTHFAYGTTVLGQSISLKTVDEAYQILHKVNKTSVIIIVGQNQVYRIPVPAKFQLSKQNLAQALPEKKVHLIKNKNFQKELTTKLTKLDLAEQAGQDAKLNFNGSLWEIVPEVNGTMVNREKLAQKVFSLASSTQKKEIRLSDFYLPVKITAQDATLNQKMKKLNQFITRTITLDIAGEKKELPKENLIKFLMETGELDQAAIKQYLINLNKEVAVINRDVRWKNPSDDKTYQFLNNYAWGWEIDITKSCQLLNQEFSKETDATTIVLPILGDTKVTSEVKNDFIWIDLLAQTMKLFRGGNEIISTPIISGHNNKGTATVPGFHTIGYKSAGQTLRGQELNGQKYSVPTKYFMPLFSRGKGQPYSTGIGIHDSNKNYSIPNAWATAAGSNGCINTPPQAMETFWNNSYPGMAVIITGNLYENSPGAYDKPVDFGKEVA